MSRSIWTRVKAIFSRPAPPPAWPGPGAGDMYYAAEKFGSALRHLATSDDAWEERLTGAFQYISPVSAADMPPDALDDYSELVARSNWAPSTGRGTRQATLAVVTDQQARCIAGLFADVSCRLDSACTAAQLRGERYGTHR